MAPNKGPRGRSSEARRALWYDEEEYSHKLRQKLKHFRIQVGLFLHSFTVQLIVSCVIVLDLSLTVAGWLGISEARWVTLTILVVLGLEVLVRLWVHEDKFRRCDLFMFTLEILIVVLGLVAYLAEGHFPVAAARAARLITRNLRALRVMVQCYGRKRKLAQAMNARLQHMLRVAFVKASGKFLRVRPENLKMDISGHFEVTKANLISGAFHDWHLPLSLLGGFVGHCRACFEHDEKVEGKEPPPHLVVKVRNLLLVLGPGPQANWQDETTIEGRKARLLKALVETFIVGTHHHHKHRQDSKARGSGGPHEQVISLMRAVHQQSVRQQERMTRFLQAMVHKRLLEGLELRIENVSLTYEDESGALFCAPNSGGVHLGSVKLQLKAEMQDDARRKMRLKYYLVQEVSRLSAFWDVGTAPFAALLRQRLYEQALQRLIRTDRMERIRLGVAKQLMPQLAHEVMSSNARGPLPEFLQQHHYLLLPVDGKVLCKLPEVTLPLGPESFGGFPSIQVELSPMRLSLDNHQACFLNIMIDYMKEWSKNDLILQQRPVQRIGPPPGKSAASDRKGKDTTKYMLTQERSQIIRQWWIHAFNLVQEAIGAPTRQAVYLNVMQIRAGYRLDYVEILITMYRRIYRQRKARKSLRHKAVSWCPKTSEDGGGQEELELQSRLQLKLSIAEVVRAHYEAKVIAAEQEEGGVHLITLAEDDEDDWNSDEEEEIDSNILASSVVSTPTLSSSSWVHHMHGARDILRSNSLIYQTMDMTPYEMMQPAVSLELPCVEIVFFVTNHYMPAPAAGRRPPAGRRRFARTLTSRAWVSNIFGEYRCEDAQKDQETAVPHDALAKGRSMVSSRSEIKATRSTMSVKAAPKARALEVRCESFGARHCGAKGEEEIEALACHGFLSDGEKVALKLVVFCKGPDTSSSSHPSRANSSQIRQHSVLFKDRPPVNTCWIGSVWIGEIRVKDGSLHLGKLLRHLKDRSESVQGTYERGSILKFDVAFLEYCKNITRTRTRQYTERREAHASSRLLENFAGTAVKGVDSSLEIRLALFVGGIRGRYVDFSFIPSGWFGQQRGRHWAIVQDFSLGPQRLVFRRRDSPPCFVVAATCPVSQPFGDQEAAPCAKQNSGDEDWDSFIDGGLAARHVNINVGTASGTPCNMSKALRTVAGAAQVSVNARSEREWGRLTRADIMKELLLEPWAHEPGKENSTELLQRWYEDQSGKEVCRPQQAGPDAEPDAEQIAGPISFVEPSWRNSCWV